MATQSENGKEYKVIYKINYVGGGTFTFEHYSTKANSLCINDDFNSYLTQNKPLGKTYAYNAQKPYANQGPDSIITINFSQVASITYTHVIQ